MQGCKNECKKYAISAALTPSTHSAGANGFLVCLMVIDVRQMQIKAELTIAIQWYSRCGFSKRPIGFTFCIAYVHAQSLRAYTSVT